MCVGLTRPIGKPRKNRVKSAGRRCPGRADVVQVVLKWGRSGYAYCETFFTIILIREQKALWRAYRRTRQKRRRQPMAACCGDDGEHCYSGGVGDQILHNIALIASALLLITKLMGWPKTDGYTDMLMWEKKYIQWFMIILIEAYNSVTLHNPPNKLLKLLPKSELKTTCCRKRGAEF